MRGLLVSLACVGCSRVTCGAGTELIDKVCEALAVPDPLECGPGTLEEEGECVAEPVPEIVCGPGTVLREDTCVAVTDEWVGEHPGMLPDYDAVLAAC